MYGGTYCRVESIPHQSGCLTDGRTVHTIRRGHDFFAFIAINRTSISYSRIPSPPVRDAYVVDRRWRVHAYTAHTHVVYTRTIYCPRETRFYDKQTNTFTRPPVTFSRDNNSNNNTQFVPVVPRSELRDADTARGRRDDNIRVRPRYDFRRFRDDLFCHVAS